MEFTQVTIIIHILRYMSKCQIMLYLYYIYIKF